MAGSDVPHAAGPRLRRSPLVIALGVVLVVAGALASAGVYTHLSQTQEVVAVVRPVARGEVIERTDLTTVQVSLDPLLTPVPASQLAEVVGQYALSDLVPGTLLAAGSFGQAIFPAADRAEVGLALMPGAYPADALRPGDAVLLVTVARPGEAEVAPVSFPGQLAMVGLPDANQMIVVAVEVAAADAPQIAAWSAADRLALVLVSREQP